MGYHLEQEGKEWTMKEQTHPGFSRVAGRKRVVKEQKTHPGFSDLSDRSAGRLLYAKVTIDMEWTNFIRRFEDYDSIAELNLKQGDLVLAFAQYLLESEKR